jgi:hypothetical protein
MLSGSVVIELKLTYYYEIMKTLEFRVWDKTEKVMKYSNPDGWDKNSVGWAGDHNFWYHVTRHYSNISDPMQYIGLNDKYGKKIFESDIVKYSNDALDEVRWENASCGFEPFSDSQNNCGCCGYGSDPKEVEVIGNIYENEDLINDSKE